MDVSNDAWSMSEAVRTGEASSVELVEQALRTIDAHEEQVNAFTVVLRDQALARAAEIDRDRPQLPLAGVPISVKDHVWLSGVPATNGSRAFEDHVPGVDAACVA